MSYSITPEQRVLKDGEEVGYILAGICYTDSPPKGRGISAFRVMVGIPELQFRPLPKTTITTATMEVPAVVVNPGKEFLQVEPRMTATEILSRRQTIPEPAKSPVLGDRDPAWQRWFIATHGEKAFTAKWPNRQLP